MSGFWESQYECMEEMGDIWRGRRGPLLSGRHLGAGSAVADGDAVVFLFMYHPNKVPKIAIMLDH